MREGMEREASGSGTGIKFTNGRDASSICIPQYKEAFLRLIGCEGDLAYNRCQWMDADLAQLADALSYAQAAGTVLLPSGLALSGNRFTDAALPSIEIILGTLPKLDTLDLRQNRFTDAALQALSALLPWRQTRLRRLGLGSGLSSDSIKCLASLAAQGHLMGLEDLRLSNNSRLGDAGASTLAELIADGSQSLPKLDLLYLDSTGMGDAGVSAITQSLGVASSPPLTKLIIGDNLFGPRAQRELTMVCDRKGIAVLERTAHW